MSDLHYQSTGLDPLILFADNHLLAVNKPAGLLTQDSGSGRRNLEDWAREWVRMDKQKTGNVFLNAVHRIDKDVSGLVLFARTSKALSRLNENIRERNCSKLYHALLEGRPTQPAGELKHWLLHEKHKAVIAREGQRDARQAVLRYRTLRAQGSQTLVEIDLETGRYHQIRAQFAAINCPICGDVKYGASAGDAAAGIALHHRRLEVIHPTRKEPVVIEAPYPADSEWWKEGSA